MKTKNKIIKKDNGIIEIQLSTNTLKDYDLFLKCKQLPKYKIHNNTCITDENSYNYVFNSNKIEKQQYNDKKHILFDYQQYIVNVALQKKRYAVFTDCGIGKTFIELAFADTINGKVLYLCPLSVMDDILKEAERLDVKISNLRYESWNEKIGLINFESMKHLDTHDIKGIILDESSILKGSDGATRLWLTELAANVEYRMCASATPSPNEQAEYATHAVFLGYATTLKEFYSRFFRKDGQNWIIKPHAIKSFYENLSSWACYIKSPSYLGFEKGAELDYEPEYIQLHSIDQKYKLEEQLFTENIGLSESNSIVFGGLRCDDKTDRFKQSLQAIKDKHSIIWCIRNKEEEMYYKHLKDKAILITGSVDIEKRVALINEWKKGNIQYLISKPSILGFGINLQQAEAMLYSGYNFSFEEFYQAVRRSHRFGRKDRLKVYIPIAEVENPIWDILQKKLRTFEHDILKLQDTMFKGLQNNNLKG